MDRQDCLSYPSMVTDLVQIRLLAESKEAENLEFRRYLKAHPHPVEPFRSISREIHASIDCTKCANCCRETTVNVTPEAIEAIARYLGISAEETRRQYTDRGATLRQDANGCVFLDGNLCLIYSARPRACREFPYLLTEGRSLGNRMSSICRRARICPIVYNALEIYKSRIGYPSH